MSHTSDLRAIAALSEKRAQLTKEFLHCRNDHMAEVTAELRTVEMHIADKVPALLGVLAQMQEALRWRQVSEELPDFDVHVLAMSPYWDHWRRMSRVWDAEGWLWACHEADYGGDLWDGEPPTEWLPEPPAQARASGTGEGDA